MAQIGRSIGFSLWQLQHQVQLRLEARTAALRLTLPQMATLMWLDVEPGIRSADLARELLLTPQAISLIIAKLSDAGYLDRSAPTVGRSQPLTITAAGRAVLMKAQAIVTDVHEEIFGSLQQAERSQLETLLHQALVAVRGPR